MRLARQALQSLYLEYKSFNPTQWKVAMESCNLKADRYRCKTNRGSPSGYLYFIKWLCLPNFLTGTKLLGRLLLLLGKQKINNGIIKDRKCQGNF